ncbi:MAG: hypothetical protein KGI60_00290 [Patescibacteria group bacterium]|nr:hypothetical protein [Patescibacteria group bacterium]
MGDLITASLGSTRMLAAIRPYRSQLEYCVEFSKKADGTGVVLVQCFVRNVEDYDDTKPYEHLRHWDRAKLDSYLPQLETAALKWFGIAPARQQATR